MDNKDLIGKQVTITNRLSFYFGQHGYVDSVNGEDILVMFDDGMYNDIFDRTELKVKR